MRDAIVNKIQSQQRGSPMEYNEQPVMEPIIHKQLAPGPFRNNFRPQLNTNERYQQQNIYNQRNSKLAFQSKRPETGDPESEYNQLRNKPNQIHREYIFSNQQIHPKTQSQVSEENKSNTNLQTSDYEQPTKQIFDFQSNNFPIQILEDAQDLQVEKEEIPILSDRQQSSIAPTSKSMLKTFNFEFPSEERPLCSGCQSCKVNAKKGYEETAPDFFDLEKQWPLEIQAEELKDQKRYLSLDRQTRKSKKNEASNVPAGNLFYLKYFFYTN